MKLEQEEVHISTKKTSLPAYPSKTGREVMEELSHDWVGMALTSCLGREGPAPERRSSSTHLVCSVDRRDPGAGRLLDAEGKPLRLITQHTL